MYSGMTNILGTIAKWAGLAGGILMVAKAINTAKENFLDFETGMREIWTLVDANESQIRSYTGALLDMSARVPQEIGTLEKAMYQAISSNVEMGDSLYVVERSAEAAVAGLTDVKTAVDITATVLNAYGLRVRDVVDINDTLFTGVREGKTTYDELAGSLGAIIPTAATLGVELDVLVSAIAAMTRGGIDTTNAVTYLNQVLVSILNPTREAKEEAAKYGIELSQTALHTKGLLPFLEELKEKVGDNGESMAKMFGNVRALRGVLSLTGAQMSDFNEIMGEMESKAGATEDAYGKMVDSTSNKLETLSNIWSAVGILLWEKVNPAFNAAIDVLGGLGRGIMFILDDSYKLRDMFQDLDKSSEDLSISINEVAKEVESAKSVLQMYLSELNRVSGEADSFQTSMDQLTSLVHEHNFAVSTGEGDYNRLRESIQKLVDQNPELVGMYEMEGEMIKLNIELMKAQTKARIADLEIKKQQLNFQVDEQKRAIVDAQKRLDDLTIAYRTKQEELANLAPLRDALSEYYEQITEIRNTGVFGQGAIEQSEKLLAFLDKYEDRLIQQNIYSEQQIENIRKEAIEIKKASEAFVVDYPPLTEASATQARQIGIEMQKMQERTKKLFEGLPIEILTNFDDEVNKLNKSLGDTGSEIEEINLSMKTFAELKTAAGNSADATEELINNLETIKDSIGSGMDDYWAKWLANERIIFDRYINDYKALKDSQSEYDRETAQRSLQSAYSTAQKIRLYATRQGDEQAKAWAASELDALSVIRKGAEETFESIVESRKRSYDKRIEEEKRLIQDLEKDLVGSENKILLDRLEAARTSLARAFIDAYFATGDESYLARIEKETAYSLDQVLSMTEKAEDTLEKLYRQRDEAIERYGRAISAGQTEDQITLARQLANTWKEIFYNTEESSDAASEAFKAWKMWEGRALLFSGELDKVTDKIANLKAVFADYSDKGRLEDAMRAAQQLSSYARSQYEYTVEIEQANLNLLLLADEYAQIASEIQEQLKEIEPKPDEGTKTRLEKFYEDLSQKEAAYYAIYSQYRAAMTRQDMEHANLYEKILSEKQSEILSAIATTYRETGNYNVFKLLGDKAKEFGITTEQVFNLVQKKQEEQASWETEQLEKINKLRTEYNALLEKGATDEAASKLKQLANANLELWLYSVVAGKEQAKYFDEYKDSIAALSVETKEAASVLDKITERARVYYHTLKQEGEEAANASREIAREIARSYKDMYQESVQTGQENQTFWSAYIFWSERAMKETAESKNKVAEYIEEIDKLVKLYDEAVAQGTLNVALDIAQSIENIYSKLSQESSQFFTEQEEWIKEVAVLRENLRTPPPDKAIDPVARLQQDLAKERELLEQATKEKLKIEEDLQNKKLEIQKQGIATEEIDKTPAVQNLQAELRQALSIVEGREKAISSIYQKLWEETKDPTWLREWVNATKQIEENTISTWENLKLRFEVMVADSKALSESAISQWELMSQLVGKLPETGRVSFLKDLFDADDKTAMEILNYVARVESAANQEVLKGLNDLIKQEEEKSRERIQQAKGTIEQILGFEHMNQQQKINYLNMFGNVFKGSKEEELQVTEMIEKEKADLEKELYEERKKAVIDEKEAESQARVEAAEREISEIASTERIGVEYRIRYLQNWMDFYEGTAEERIKLEQKVADEIFRLQRQLDKELQNKAQAIPEEVLYLKKLELLDEYYWQVLESAKGNAESEYAINVAYQKLRNDLRAEEIKKTRDAMDDIVGFARGMTDDLGKILEEGGKGAGLRFIIAFFENAESLSEKYMRQYVLDPLLDAIAEATVKVQEEEGLGFFDALAQGFSAAISGNLPQLFMTALTFNLSQAKKQFEIFWESLKNVQSKWLRNLIADIEWFFGAGADAIEQMKGDFENALSNADTFDAFAENLEETIRNRVKQGLIQAFLETAAMKQIFEKIAKEMDKALRDGEMSDKEWEKIDVLMQEAMGKSKEFWEKARDWLEVPEEIDTKRANTVKSITEQTANVLLAIERSSNLYLREINENIRAMRFLMQGWSFNSPVNVGFETQQTLRSHGL